MEELIAKYLANELEKEERSRFEEQVLLDDELSNELQQAIASWELFNSGSNSNADFNSTVAWSKVAEQITNVRKLQPEKTNYSFLKIAASILLIATAGFFILKSTNVIDSQSGIIEISASSNEVEEFELPDGSIIRLNANSVLTHNETFGVDNRVVTLTGAANFDVERNENIPFIISTATSQVEVLGTSFEVRAFNNESVEVNVSSGKVGFSSTKAKGEAQVLLAGDKAVLSSDGTQIQRDKVRNQNYAGWWTKKLVFDGTKLSEVAKDLEKTYWVKIKVADSIKDCPITQILENKTFDEVLEILGATFPSMTITTEKENHIKLDGIICTD